MAVQAPCSACSWTSERQAGCRYHSHVKLFYGVSDRGVWSLGSNLILKERPSSLPNFEAVNIRFLRTMATIPIPDIVEEWSEADGRYFIITKRIRGQPLSTAWASMSPADRDRVAEQTAGFLEQLRGLHSPRMQSLDGAPVFSAFLFMDDFGHPHGPLSTDDELWEEMATSLGGLSEKARQRLRKRMPPGTPYTFTHGDLTNVNIMVEDGNLAGILDWEGERILPGLVGVRLRRHRSWRGGSGVEGPAAEAYAPTTPRRASSGLIFMPSLDTLTWTRGGRGCSRN